MNKIIILLFANLLLIIRQSSAQTYKGIVLDAKTKSTIAYANVGIPNKGYGVVCNEQGEFILKITTEKDTDIVQIFNIGYKTQDMRVRQFKAYHENEPVIIYLTEVGYELATVTVRPNDYEQMVVGSKDVSMFECEGAINISTLTTDTAVVRMKKEKGISDKSIGVEIGNKIKIDKGQQTFIDKIRFKTCLKPNDTCIYRINIYENGIIKQRHMTPIGMIKIINATNILKAPIITKVIGKSEVQELDVSTQNIEVDDDFIISIECIYSSNRDMNLAVKTSIFGSTDLLVRISTMAEWIKIPLLDVTFVSATVTYKKKKSFWSKLFN